MPQGHQGRRYTSKAGSTQRLVALAGTLLWLVTLAAPRGMALELDVVETENLRLVYLAPGQSYIVPYVARSFETSARLPGATGN